MTDSSAPLSERQQTDESLRLERERADRALDDEERVTADRQLDRERTEHVSLLFEERQATDWVFRR